MQVTRRWMGPSSGWTEGNDVATTTTRLPALTLADQSDGYRAVVKARLSGTRVTIYYDFIFIRSGRAVADVDVTTAGTPYYSTAERTRLATTIRRTNGRFLTAA